VAVLLTVAVASLEAYVITPWLTSRAGDMNAATVFIGLVFWGWLWGLPGLLLAVPLLMVTKAIAEHVESLQPLAVLLRK
jgi:predicted PurR-regulated permease PerM